MKEVTTTHAGFTTLDNGLACNCRVNTTLLRINYMMNSVRTHGVRNRARLGFLIAAAFLMVATSLNAKERVPSSGSAITFEVKGLVRDAHSKQPIAAAQIQAQNNRSSATTDQDGRFSIKVLSTDEVLMVTAFDYSLREVPVRAKDALVIDLYPDVFSTYYTTQELVSGKKRNSTTVPAIKTVNDFTLSQAVSADEFVQSELGGHIRSISRSGFAGMGSSMFIRGYNSLLANAQPLYVVDGVIIDNCYEVESIYEGHFQNPLLNIDIKDIESITVMKDGTSIYGSKGSNGVILIKTSRGKDQVTKINLHIMAGSISTPNTTPVMNADDYRIYLSDMLRSAGYTSKQLRTMPFLEQDPNATAYAKYHNQTDWNNEVYEQGRTQSYMVNVNGGDDKALYYFSVGYTKNDGLVKTTDLSRINTRFNSDIKLTNEVELGVNIAYTNVEKTLLDDGANFYTSPTYLSQIKAPFLSPHTFTDYGIETVTNADADEFGIGNPAGLIEKSLNYTRQHYFNLSFKPTWSINKDLTLTSQFNYNMFKYEENLYSPYLGVATRFLEGYGYSQNAIRNQINRNNSLTTDTKLQYTKRFNKVHQVEAIAGWRYTNRSFESDYIEVHNTGSDNNTLVRNNYDFRQNRGINDETGSISNYGSVDYNYSNRYFLSAAMAIDGSSRFGNQTEGGFQLFGHSWGVFPSINGAWLLSSEAFMQDLTAINLLKLRAGYGVTGNDGIQDFASKTYFASVRYLGYANGIILKNVSNKKLQWETTGRASLGFDLGAFNERFNLSFDLYTAKTSNLLIWKNLGEMAGISAYQTNAGTLSNKGFEVAANLKVLNFKKLQWEVGLTAGHYKNQLLTLPEGDILTSVYGGTVLSRVGQSAGVFYGWKTDGVFKNQAEADAANLSVLNINGTYSKFAAGDVKFVDNKVDGVINDDDRQIIGDPNPSIYGSFNSKLSFMKFTLNALFNYSYGNDVYNYLRSQLESGETLSNQSTVMLSRWRAEDQATNQPKAVFGDPMGNARFSDRWIEDGSFLRLKTVSLSYALPIRNQFIYGLDIWVAANNLFTVTNYLGSDPEFSAGNGVLYQGVDAGLIPLTRSFFMGVKINL